MLLLKGPHADVVRQSCQGEVDRGLVTEKRKNHYTHPHLLFHHE